MSASQATRLVAKYAFGLAGLAVILETLSLATGLPGSRQILSGQFEQWMSGTLTHDVLVTVARCTIGWLVGAPIGIALGFVTGRSRAASTALEGLFTLLRAIPFIALAPLSLRLFGLNESGKVFLVAWAVAGVCWVVMHETARSLPAEMLWRAQSLGTSTFKWITRILLPGTSNGVFAALRTSLSIGLIVVAVAEMGGVYERTSGLWWSEGLGYRIFRAYDIARDDLLLGGILVFSLIGILLDGILILITWLFTATLNRSRQSAAISAFNGADSRGQQRVGYSSAGELKGRAIGAGYRDNTVFDGLDISVSAGETLSIVGPSGCGKTTLLRAIGRFHDDTFFSHGEVLLDGVAVSAPNADVGVVFQNAPVYDFMTVWENVVFGSRVTGRAGAELARQLLEEFGLGHKVADFANELSGGERQRLALCASLANAPRILLLDEPFGALDAFTRRQLQTFFDLHVRSRVSTIFVTHDINEALIVGDSVLVGVDERARSFVARPKDHQIEDWEFSSDFSSKKRDVLLALKAYTAERAAGDPPDSDS